MKRIYFFKYLKSTHSTIWGKSYLHSVSETSRKMLLTDDFFWAIVSDNHIETMNKKLHELHKYTRMKTLTDIKEFCGIDRNSTMKILILFYFSIILCSKGECNLCFKCRNLKDWGSHVPSNVYTG